MSIVGARMTVKMGYRVVAIGGNALMTIGFVGMSVLDADTPRWFLLASCTVLGAGMGSQMLSLLLAAPARRGQDAARAGHVAHPVLA